VCAVEGDVFQWVRSPPGNRSSRTLPQQCVTKLVTARQAGKGLEIGQSINSKERSETADDVARDSEG